MLHPQPNPEIPVAPYLLVVDDDPIFAALLAEVLRRGGFQLTVASGVAEALAAIAVRRPDLAILDILLAEESGLDLATRLRDDFDIPFMMLSGLDDAETVQRANDLGALAYLLKATDARQWILTVVTALLHAAERQQLRVGESRFAHALTDNRATSMAVGVLMERQRVDRRQAFELLRARARAERRKIGEVAEELLQSVEKLNSWTEVRPGNGGTPRKL